MGEGSRGAGGLWAVESAPIRFGREAGLGFGPDGALRCFVKDGLCEARFLRPAQIELLSTATTAGSAAFVPGPHGTRIPLHLPAAD